jgi:hypothetical protein
MKVFSFQPFQLPPKVLLSVRHAGATQQKDIMSFWADDVSGSQFRVCLREMVSFSGAHENLYLVSLIDINFEATRTFPAI